MGLFRTLFVALPAIVLLYSLYDANLNPTGMGGPVTIEVITSSPGVEKHLSTHKNKIGGDYDGYRGHVYRVLTYTKHFLGKEIFAKYQDAIELALVYHDIALWTDSELAYLEPSVERAKEALKAAEKIDQKHAAIIEDIIMFHHKVFEFTEGPNKDHVAVVEAVRKADWIDATQGVLRKGVSKSNIAEVHRQIANNGFHQTLVEFVPRLHGWNIHVGLYELAHIMRL